MYGVSVFSIILLLILYLLLQSESYGFAQQCSSSSHLGNVECVLFTPYYYPLYQCTCLTKTYIQRVSNQRLHCPGHASKCWYQCQHDLNCYASSDHLYDSCRCSPNEPLPTSNPNVPTLAPSCASPGGLDCSWYRECLEVRYPCKDTDDGYAIQYAEKFCNLYSINYNDFSSHGRIWINAVRKCLQLALVPHLRPWVRKSCADLRSDAFISHPSCYVSPSLGAPSVCDLSCSDIWKIFWIVNFEGNALGSVPFETGKQILEVAKGCISTTGCIGTAIRLSIPGLAQSQDIIQVTTGIGRFIAKMLRLNTGWFPFVDSSPDSEYAHGNEDMP